MYQSMSEVSKTIINNIFIVTVDHMTMFADCEPAESYSFI